MEEMTPEISLSVHYVSYGSPGGEFTSECRAAVITELVPEPDPHEGSQGTRIGLAVFNPSGMYFCQARQSEPIKAGGTWHWPGCQWDERGLADLTVR